ncbi:putative cryptochrome dash protein [Neofusicoccum parvum UCRNP2]|uniref:Putative cryptochrome dash protein n=1 Tax=Botryosphaeria parva (strain UCR-NP2) TaxID=1287680 RepID=R1EGA5_BOTPV|nr:putative cryptochrome dash protein [Neofusicoccum parvum UCRNP2]
MSSAAPRVLIYLLRRDLRVADNPIFHQLTQQAASGSSQFTHVLPVYVLSANQIEVSGFLKDDAKSPYPEARSQVAGFWRCGPHRAKFTAESVWDLKESLGKIGSDLVIRIGMERGTVAAIWMTAEEGVEEKREQRDARKAAEASGVEFKLWTDEKYFVDDRDLPFTNIKDLPDVYTTFRSMANYKDTRNGLLGEDYSTKISSWLALGCITARQIHSSLVAYEDGSQTVPDSWKAAPGFGKGESTGTAAVRFELLWRDYMRLCTRKFGPRLFHVDGFRSDEPVAAAAAAESGGSTEGATKKKWRYLDRSGGAGDDPAKTRQAVERFRAGRTGVGLIDASQRELFLTGYTSNRARQNVASFLASHLGIDWRVGAEWYECALVDHDLSNNWGNWQYVAGVGNDPRQGRRFNPVKQALDYDRGGAYIKTWVEELRDVDVDGAQGGGRKGEEMLMGLFQAWRLPEKEKERLNLKGVEWVERPLVRIPFAVGNKGGGGGGAGGDNRRGSGRGGRGFRGRGRGGGRPRRMGDMDRAAKQGQSEDGQPSQDA